MPATKDLSKQRKNYSGTRACTTVTFFLGASFSAMAASLPAAPGVQQSEILQQVKKAVCYKLPPYATKGEATAAADNAKAQGSSASVKQAPNGDWVVTVCDK
jgi:hypothetical protein